MQLSIKLNETDEKGALPLDLALSTGQEDLARTLIEHRVNVNQTNPSGATLLHNSICRGNKNLLLGDAIVIILRI